MKKRTKTRNLSQVEQGKRFKREADEKVLRKNKPRGQKRRIARDEANGGNTGEIRGIEIEEIKRGERDGIGTDNEKRPENAKGGDKEKKTPEKTLRRVQQQL